jgi:hypothetical protein
MEGLKSDRLLSNRRRSSSPRRASWEPMRRRPPGSVLLGGGRLVHLRRDRRACGAVARARATEGQLVRIRGVAGSPPDSGPRGSVGSPGVVPHTSFPRSRSRRSRCAGVLVVDVATAAHGELHDAHGTSPLARSRTLSGRISPQAFSVAGQVLDQGREHERSYRGRRQGLQSSQPPLPYLGVCSPESPGWPT